MQSIRLVENCTSASEANTVCQYGSVVVIMTDGTSQLKKSGMPLKKIVMRVTDEGGG